MPQSTDNQNDNPDDHSDKPHDLRKQLEAALAANKELSSQMAGLQGQVLMPTLNDRQRRAVMRELETDKLDLNSDNVTKVAEDLGFSLTSEPPPPASGDGSTPPTDQPDGQPTGDGNGQQQGDNTPLPPHVQAILESMGYVDVVRQHSGQGPDENDFKTKMEKAGSREELRSLIQTEGHRHGLIHEWDVI